MTNPVWDGVEIDYGALDGYGWRVTKIAVGSITYPLFLGYQVAALREMDGKIAELGGPTLVSSSSSSLTIGAGIKSISVEPGKALGAGSRITVADTAAPTARWESGQVISYNSTTGNLSYEVSVGNFQGSGSGTAWSITIAGEQGPPGSISGGTATSDIIRDGPAGTFRLFRLATGGVRRFEIGIDAAAETGGNEGSNLFLTLFDDAGDWVSTPITIHRATGTTQIGGVLDLNGNSLTRATLSQTRMAIGDLGNTSGNQAVTASSQNALTATLVDDTTFDFTSLGADLEYTRRMRLVQGGVGGFVPTWHVDGAGTNVKPQATAPNYAVQAPGTVTWVTVQVWGTELHVWQTEESA